MVERSTKPSAIPISPSVPAPLVTVSDDNSRVVASLPTGDRVEVLLYGATVVSWKSADGRENLFLSSKAILDGSKAVRGGIPLVFPLFGPASGSHPETAKLPQHGFARTSRWEYLGKSSSESSSLPGTGGDASVQLDFGLSDAMLDGGARGAWPHAFGLEYSVTLASGELTTSLRVQNTGEGPWEFQTLLHSYFGVEDITKTSIVGLEETPYLDKTATPTPTAPTAASKAPLNFAAETDRVYASALGTLTITQSNARKLEIRREGLDDVVVWNPWEAKSKGMSDFGPEDGWKRMVCVEAGSVKDWNRLEGGEVWEGRVSARVL